MVTAVYLHLPSNWFPLWKNVTKVHCAQHVPGISTKLSSSPSTSTSFILLPDSSPFSAFTQSNPILKGLLSHSLSSYHDDVLSSKTWEWWQQGALPTRCSRRRSPPRGSGSSPDHDYLHFDAGDHNDVVVQGKNIKLDQETNSTASLKVKRIVRLRFLKMLPKITL